jgi:hypothetical protein
MIFVSKVIVAVEHLIQIAICRNILFARIDNLIIFVFLISLDVNRKQSFFMVNISEGIVGALLF